ncbi:hypothetical protein FisN_25Hh195 [Fistulifera solaris]|uniref:Uncharacterized protein n=1 Tax=Fistulifera solaris TaxID=1519565 RepID=A0A1Z5JWT7_FISSO|nr:hypothetical protein FisN_25Hh195 [Fistulifera solaris]|eukprot:GAX18211.1 hypothetical protein FisN_25Hh195 [Fistulifera solaris]
MISFQLRGNDDVSPVMHNYSPRILSENDLDQDAEEDYHEKDEDEYEYENEGHDEDDGEHGGYEVDENREMPPEDPEKIDMEDVDAECETWLERANEFINGDYDAFSRPCGEVKNATSHEFGEEIVPDVAVGNFFRFSIFMTLPPNWQSTGNTLDDALTTALDAAFPQYRIMTDHNEYDWGPPSEEIEADIMSYKVKPNRVRKDEDFWWWQYSFKYFCYVPGTTDPIDNETGREAFRNVMIWIKSTEHQLETISGIAEQMQGISYDLQMNPPVPCDECVHMSPCYGLECDLSPTYAPPVPESDGGPITMTVPPSFPPTLTPSMRPSHIGAPPQTGITTTGEIVLDPSAWDWRRYSGLALLLTTVMGTFCLSQMARLRTAARSRKEDWGNLATEEGVDELLRTGWKVKGSLMEVYDRKNMGYRDDDSMLIGGYEQRVPVGSEIAVSRTQSETVQETIAGTAQS